VLYVLMLVWMLFQTVHDARQFLKVGSRKHQQRMVVGSGESTRAFTSSHYFPIFLLARQCDVACRCQLLKKVLSVLAAFLHDRFS